MNLLFSIARFQFSLLLVFFCAVELKSFTMQIHKLQPYILFFCFDHMICLFQLYSKLSINNRSWGTSSNDGFKFGK